MELRVFPENLSSIGPEIDFLKSNKVLEKNNWVHSITTCATSSQLRLQNCSVHGRYYNRLWVSWHSVQRLRQTQCRASRQLQRPTWTILRPCCVHDPSRLSYKDHEHNKASKSSRSVSAVVLMPYTGCASIEQGKPRMRRCFCVDPRSKAPQKAGIISWDDSWKKRGERCTTSITSCIAFFRSFQGKPTGEREIQPRERMNKNL